MTEQWRDIPGYEGRYQASDAGRVRSVNRWVRCGRGGKGRRLVKGRVLKPGPMGKYGHLCVVLGKGNTVGVHVAVALAFLGPRPRGLDVAHRNGMGWENAPSNLKYATRAENNLDKIPTGRARVTLGDVAELRACGTRAEALAIGRELGISDSYSNNIRLYHDVKP